MKRSFWRYIVVGLLGTVAHLSTLWLLVEQLKVAPIPASVAGFMTALGLSYWINAHWTFGSPTPTEQSSSHRRAFTRYTIVSIAGLCLNTLIMYVLTHVFGFWYMTGQLIAALVVPLHNFALNFYWTFNQRR
jgi:putative flippase GtrA